MKGQNRVSLLTLELYRKGLATRQERKLVEEALETDSKVRQQYEALGETDREIRQLVSQELSRLNVPEKPSFPAPRNKSLVFGIIAAAAILLCALVPTILYLKSSNANKGNVIAEETVHESNTAEEPITTEDILVEGIEEIAAPSEPPTENERGSSNTRIEIAETPRSVLGRPTEITSQTEETPSGGTIIAAIQEPGTGIRLRGGTQTGDTPGNTAVPEEQPNINLPTGLSLIFDNMFANQGLSYVIIPSRITSIGKNAFSGNPLLSVSLGANVSIEDNAIPGNFASAYSAYGKAAGIYTRADVESEEWIKR
jgi:hypothetical protein